MCIYIHIYKDKNLKMEKAITVKKKKKTTSENQMKNLKTNENTIKC